MVKVIFLHPDLGIGGAERLVVDAGLALKRHKHDVVFYTSHHDKNHCFPETVDGSLKVKCVGDWLPRSIAGYLMAFCAYVRMIYLAICIRWYWKIEYDIAIVDQVSACVPFLCGRQNSKVLFYCHYPDQLLTQRNSLMKKVYRYFLDWLEEYTTGCADSVLVNSKFTATIFKKTFTTIKTTPAVLYPSLNFSTFDTCEDVPLKKFGLECDYDVLFLSVNRFERKKNLALALHALEHLIYKLSQTKNGQGSKESVGGTSDEGSQISKNLSMEPLPRIRLIMAGGYDTRNIENIQHYNELLSLCTQLKLDDHVTFIKSPNENYKVNLLRKSACLVYTPDCEHFGIVPIEAMYCRTPVIAVNSGGPMETVHHNKTGFLCPQTPRDFAVAMNCFVTDAQLKTVMGNAGHERVMERFAFDKFSSNMDAIVTNLAGKKRK